MELCQRLHIPGLKEARRRIGPTEFLWWTHKLRLDMEDDLNRRHREDWYFAQIAFWLYLVWHAVKHVLSTRPDRPNLKMEDFLIEFGPAKPVAATPVPEDEELGEEEAYQRLLKEKTEASMAAWGAFLAGQQIRTNGPARPDVMREAD